jgi:hypothetical protein
MCFESQIRLMREAPICFIPLTKLVSQRNKKVKQKSGLMLIFTCTNKNGFMGGMMRGIGNFFKHLFGF